MNDWLRSLALLGMASAAVVVTTLGLAGAIVPSVGGDVPGAQAPSGAPQATVAAAPYRPGTVGGALTVTGDREGVLVLDREVVQDRYGLAGDDGRVLFEGGDAVTVAQLQYDGLEFFVDPDECTVTPGERHDASGVAAAEIACDGISDVRDKGTIDLAGTVGLAADLFGLRGDLPETGGEIGLGDETLTIGPARLATSSFGSYVGQLMAEEHGRAVGLGYDPRSHEFSVAEIVFDGDVVRVEGGCSVAEREIGMLNPHTRVSELTLECASIRIPSLGDVPLRGSVIVEIAEPPS